MNDEDRAAILARRRRFIALAVGGLATGCGPIDLASDGGTTTNGSSSVGSSTGSSSSSSAETEAGIETETETGLDSTTVLFVPTGPQPCLSAECDTFAQDCPEGEKCVPYASKGGTWDANKCVVVQGDGATGEPCTSSSLAEASDDCDELSFCWDVQDVDGTPMGVCTAFCEGTADNWTCADGEVCLIANEGSVTLCIAECDPLMQDCGEGLGCSWNGESFGCVVTTEGLALGDPCGFANDCAPGSLCLGADASPICAGAACCVEYCSTDELGGCSDPQLECAGFFEDGLEPAGLETLGLCVVPGACDGANSDCGSRLTIDG